MLSRQCSCFFSSYFEALQRERCSVSLWCEHSSVPGVLRGPKRHPDKAAVAGSIIRLHSLLMDPPSAEVKSHHSCFQHVFVGLFVTAHCQGAVPGVTGGCWGRGTEFLLCQDEFWCCWERGCWGTRLWGKN